MRLTKILVLIKLIFCKLSPEDIRDTLNSINNEYEIDRIMRCSVINPIYGYLFESIGALDNIRFFGPRMKTQKTENSRNYALDSTEDVIVKLIIELFPSPTGVLCHIRNKKDNFGYVFKNNKKEGIEFMSNMFLNLLGIETNYSTDNQVFNRIQSVIVNKEDCCFGDAKNIKLLTLHSFILNVLDDKNDLKEYIESIVRKVEMKYLDKILIYDVTNEVLRLRRDYLSFPYSELNQPCSNSIVPIYDRKNDKFIQKTFSDCADIVILHICNCLFYDNEKFCYSIDSLDPNSDLFKFYENHKELFTITDDIRKDWSRVIQGLDNFEVEDKSIYKLHKIAYLKEKRNEVDTGIINMMNILIKICNLNHQEIMRDFDPNSIFESLEMLFKKISTERISIKVHKLFSNEIEMDCRTEILGSFDIILKDKSGRSIVINVNQTKYHAYMEVKEYESILQDSDNPLVSFDKNIFSVLFQSYTNIIRKTNFNSNLTIFEYIYLSNPIKSLHQKKNVMLEIVNCIASFPDVNSHPIFRGILDLIVDSINLNDIGTRLFYLPCLVFYNLTDYEVLAAWLLSLQFKLLNIHKLWESRMITANSSKIILNFEMVPNERIGEVFSVLSKLSGLRELFLIGMDQTKAISISNSLSTLTQITKLDISSNFINVEGMKKIATEIGYLVNLNSLNIASNRLEFEGSIALAKALSKLKGLACLNISFCNIGTEGMLYIASYLPCCPNLESINLSGNNICDQGSIHLSDVLGFMKNLACIDLSNNKLTQQVIRKTLESISLDHRRNEETTQELSPEIKETIRAESCNKETVNQAEPVKPEA